MGSNNTPATPVYTHLISDERWGETCLIEDMDAFVRDMEASMSPPTDVRQAYLDACDSYTANGEEIPTDVTEANIVAGWRDELRAACQDVEPVTLADGRTGYMTSSEAVYVPTANGLASYEGEWADLKPIRLRVREAIGDHASDVLRKSHERNYDTLYVDSDGDLWWSEEVDSNTWQTRNGEAVPYLAKVGTGSTPCNCDWCQGPDAVDSAAEIEFDSEEIDYACAEMVRHLDEIPMGYFDDETAPDEA